MDAAAAERRVERGDPRGDDDLVRGADVAIDPGEAERVGDADAERPDRGRRRAAASGAGTRRAPCRRRTGSTPSYGPIAGRIASGGPVRPSGTVSRQCAPSNVRRPRFFTTSDTRVEPPAGTTGGANAAGHGEARRAERHEDAGRRRHRDAHEGEHEDVARGRTTATPRAAARRPRRACRRAA